MGQVGVPSSWLPCYNPSALTGYRVMVTQAVVLSVFYALTLGAARFVSGELVFMCLGMAFFAITGLHVWRTLRVISISALDSNVQVHALFSISALSLGLLWWPWGSRGWFPVNVPLLLVSVICFILALSSRPVKAGAPGAVRFSFRPLDLQVILYDRIDVAYITGLVLQPTLVVLASVAHFKYGYPFVEALRPLHLTGGSIHLIAIVLALRKTPAGLSWGRYVDCLMSPFQDPSGVNLGCRTESYPAHLFYLLCPGSGMATAGI